MLIEVDERLPILLGLALLSFCALGESGVMCLSSSSRVEIGVWICDLAVSRCGIVEVGWIGAPHGGGSECDAGRAKEVGKKNGLQGPSLL